MSSLTCLALALYFEARSEPAHGQMAVGQVIMRRVESPRYPNTVCGVVWQHRQFSWTHDGKSDVPDDAKSFAKSLHYAKYLLLHRSKMQDYTQGAMHYYNPALADPYWARGRTAKTRIGNHEFVRF